MAITITAIKDYARYTPSDTIKLTWTSSEAASKYRLIITNKTDNKIIKDTGVVNSTVNEFVVDKSILNLNCQYTWKVRSWSSSGIDMSLWSSKGSFAYENGTIATIGVIADKKRNVRVVNANSSISQPTVKMKLNNTIVDIDTVPIDSEYATPIKVKINGNVKSMAEFPGQLVPSYNNHTDSGYSAYNNHSNSGYGQYSNHTNSGYGKYDNHTNSGYGEYNNWANSGYSKYNDWKESGYSAYNDHSQGGYAKIYQDGAPPFYSDRYSTGYRIYSNHSATGYSAYSDHYNTGYSAYDNHTATGYSAYDDHGQSGYSAYNDHGQSGYSQYANHSDTIGNLI